MIRARCVALCALALLACGCTCPRPSEGRQHALRTPLVPPARSVLLPAMRPAVHRVEVRHEQRWFPARDLGLWLQVEVQ